MSNLTPMKRYATNLQTFSSLLGLRFESTTLNRSSAKSNWFQGEHHTTKGVDNDFVMIFRSQEANNNSLAFSFDFLDLPSENHSVMASIKLGESNDNIVFSEQMNLLEFKEKLNNFNNWALNFEKKKKSSIDSFTIFNQFSEVFLGQSLDMKKEVKTQIKAKEDFVAEISKQFNIPELQSVATQAKEKLDETTQKINSTIKKLPEYKKLKELEAEMAQLKASVATKEKQLNIEHNTAGLINQAEETSEDLRVANLYLQMEIKERGSSNRYIKVPKPRKLKY